jgi:hypothetical protein
MVGFFVGINNFLKLYFKNGIRLSISVKWLIIRPFITVILSIDIVYRRLIIQNMIDPYVEMIRGMDA